MAVYDSPVAIKEAGLSEVTLELSATDTAEIMSRLNSYCSYSLMPYPVMV